ncbi:MAG: diguanylate cyclase [Gammaproteobacteria bacterium]|jgi:diguanylate cyclase (GGDEF)-like protein|nr:diguanylate cyclase [Gammaproteobacteria bacterium]
MRDTREGDADRSGFRLYDRLSRLPLGNRFANKIFLIVFVGTHVPLLALLAYFLVGSDALGAHLDVLAVALLATLAGFIASLLLLRALLAPVTLTADALEDFRTTSTVPDLPTHYRDELGSLMASVQQTTERLDAVIVALDEAAHTDELTGAFNRRAARRQLASLVERSRNRGFEVHLAIIDLDGFKSVNDRFGHPVGDRLLRAFGTEVSKRLRPSDWLARVGGDEFLLVMSDCSRAEMVERVQRLQHDMAERPIEHVDGEPVTLSFSFGVARVDGEDPETILERADAELYRQKPET